jgi:hypothetical protein
LFGVLCVGAAFAFYKAVGGGGQPCKPIWTAPFAACLMGLSASAPYIFMSWLAVRQMSMGSMARTL